MSPILYGWVSAPGLLSQSSLFLFPFFLSPNLSPHLKWKNIPSQPCWEDEVKHKKLPLRAGINTGSNYNINMAGIMKPETTDIWRKLRAPELQMRDDFWKRKLVAPETRLPCLTHRRDLGSGAQHGQAGEGREEKWAGSVPTL